jgi:hypothetical protein
MAVIKKTKSDRIKKTLSKIRKGSGKGSTGLGGLSNAEAALIRKFRKLKKKKKK